MGVVAISYNIFMTGGIYIMVSFGTAFKRFWRGYVNLSGRATRAEYWWNGLWLGIVAIVAIVILLASGMNLAFMADRSAEAIVRNLGAMAGFIGVFLFFLIFTAVIYLPALALWIRRLRDTGLSLPVVLAIEVGFAFISGMAANGNMFWIILTIFTLIAEFVLSVLPTDIFKKGTK
jgi:uncharacterized membrane protein YhaH (DUF805 family)